MADRVPMPDDGAVIASSGGGPTGALWPALGVSRFVLLGYAAAVNVAHAPSPGPSARVWAALAVMAAWTLTAPLLSAVPARRPALIGAELGLAGGLLLLTPWLRAHAAADPHAPSVPSFWIAAAVLACAIQWGWAGGLGGAGLLAVADLAVRPETTATTAANIFLLALLGLVVGYAATLVRAATRERAEAAAVEAAAAERDRLARAVHDGVLQTLAYVGRRGAEIGGPTAALAALAGRQEHALRGLLAGALAGAPGVGAHGGDARPAGDRDVAAMLAPHAGPTVSVATPEAAVSLPDPAAEELVAAVRAALDNTARHAGGAAGYVLLEDTGDAVVVSVGDHGPGICPGRLEQAAADGRMGVTHCIRSRMTALGGSAHLHTDPGAGTEWELRVPRGARP